jgi:hypothetical protein
MTVHKKGDDVLLYSGKKEKEQEKKTHSAENKGKRMETKQQYQRLHLFLVVPVQVLFVTNHIVVSKKEGDGESRKI